MLSALCFIPRGAAAAEPIEAELSAEEVEQLVQKQAAMTLKQVDEEVDKALDEDDSDSDEEEDEMNDDDNTAAEKKDAEMVAESAPSAASTAEQMDAEEKLLQELKMDGYDEEEEGAELFLAGQKLTVHASNAEDPYITVPDDDDVDGEEEEDLKVKDSDVLICVGRTEEEASTLEVYLYEEESGNLYVHHDFNLPSFPLSLCWLDCDPRGASNTPTASDGSVAAASAASSSSAAPEKGSFLAIGTFQTGIEIWNLDILDALEPVAVLGGRHEPDPEQIRKAVEERERERKAASKGKKKKKNTVISPELAAQLQGELKAGSHADAVMCLGWHPAFRTRLASGSADHTVKLWDVCTQQCVATFSALHKNKVQSLQWNYTEPHVLLTGAYDQTVCVSDIRASGPAAGGKDGVLRFKVPADIEQCRWSPHQPFLFASALENGAVTFFDARQAAAAAAASSTSASASSSPLFTLAAHNLPCTSLSFNAVLPSCFSTASIDKSVKVWDFTPQPTLISQKEVKAAGKIFTAAFDVNYAHIMAFGGDKGKLGVWDLREDSKLRARYGEEVNGQGGKGGSSTHTHASATSTQSTLFAQPPPSTNGAASSSADASGGANGGGEEKKKKKKNKKKMKTSMRRKPEEEGGE